jgi:hypothetical protein
MELLTVAEMAAKLGVEKNAIHQRLHNAKIKPVYKNAVYLPSDFETIAAMSKVGRPKKEESDDEDQ